MRAGGIEMIYAKDIVDFLQNMGVNAICYGNEYLRVNGFSSISNMQHGTVTWLRKFDKGNIPAFNEFHNILLITTPEVYEHLKGIHESAILVDHPKMCFFETVKNFFLQEPQYYISPTADIRTINVGRDVAIGSYCSIGENVIIGDRVIIEDHVQIENHVQIGNDCVISSGVVIGANGFGYYRDIDGNNSAVPHIGGVRIGDHVDIGSNTCIDRGTIEDTIIGDYTKIDNLCHIGHNAKIGKNVFIIALSMIGGSAVLEDEVYVAPGAKIMNQLHVGKNAFVGMGAVVTKSVGENDVVAGVPARVIRKRLPEDRE
jgi:UDP-3-O-[3-hydroxymyristoyl] glucosamine N-acyltransferase LpxD